jgi:hypothetical protein
MKRVTGIGEIFFKAQDQESCTNGTPTSANYEKADGWPGSPNDKAARSPRTASSPLVVRIAISPRRNQLLRDLLLILV